MSNKSASSIALSLAIVVSTLGGAAASGPTRTQATAPATPEQMQAIIAATIKEVTSGYQYKQVTTRTATGPGQGDAIQRAVDHMTQVALRNALERVSASPEVKAQALRQAAAAAVITPNIARMTAFIISPETIIAFNAPQAPASTRAPTVAQMPDSASKNPPTAREQMQALIVETVQRETATPQYRNLAARISSGSLSGPGMDPQFQADRLLRIAIRSALSRVSASPTEKAQALVQAAATSVITPWLASSTADAISPEVSAAFKSGLAQALDSAPMTTPKPLGPARAQVSAPTLSPAPTSAPKTLDPMQALIAEAVQKETATPQYRALAANIARSSLTGSASGYQYSADRLLRIAIKSALSRVAVSPQQKAQALHQAAASSIITPGLAREAAYTISAATGAAFKSGPAKAPVTAPVLSQASNSSTKTLEQIQALIAEAVQKETSTPQYKALAARLAKGYPAGNVDAQLSADRLLRLAIKSALERVPASPELKAQALLQAAAASIITPRLASMAAYTISPETGAAFKSGLAQAPMPSAAILSQALSNTATASTSSAPSVTVLGTLQGQSSIQVPSGPTSNPAPYDPCAGVIAAYCGG